jgi:glycosyltransferase involved in cell wall biosynthesis
VTGAFRVVVVASTFPAGADDTVPPFVRDQVVALKNARPDWQFTVLAPHDARSATVNRTEHGEFTEVRFNYFRPRRWQSLAGHGIMPTIRRNPAQVLAIPGLCWGEYRALRNLVAQERPDVIYAHWFTPQAVTSWAVSRRTRVPFVFTTHASDVAVWRRLRAVGRAIVSRVTRRAVGFTAVSQASLDRMRPFFDVAAWNKLQQRAQVIPMGVDLPRVKVSAVGTNDLYPGRRVILFMGRLTHKKGLPYLLDAFAAVRAEAADVHLVVAGDGPQRTELQEQAGRLGIKDAVDFVGFVSGTRKDDFYRRADICVLPSVVASDGDAEGMPVVLLESLAYGKPTIATDATNAAEIVTDGTDAIVCRAGDSAALGNALRDVLSWDDERRSAMSAKARATAEAFSWPLIAERTAAFLLDPIAEQCASSS